MQGKVSSEFLKQFRYTTISVTFYVYKWVQLCERLPGETVWKCVMLTLYLNDYSPSVVVGKHVVETSSFWEQPGLWARRCMLGWIIKCYTNSSSSSKWCWAEQRWLNCIHYIVYCIMYNRTVVAFPNWVSFSFIYVLLIVVYTRHIKKAASCQQNNSIDYSPPSVSTVDLLSQSTAVFSGVPDKPHSPAYNHASESCKLKQKEVWSLN